MWRAARWSTEPISATAGRALFRVVRSLASSGSAVSPASRRRAAAEQGQALVEAALVFPVLLMIAIALLQFGLYAHAAHVVAAAAEEGARVAAAEDGSLQDGVTQAQAVLQAGLGPSAGDISLRAADDGQTVTLAATGQLRLLIPWSADASLPLAARAVVAKERFRAGGI